MKNVLLLVHDDEGQEARLQAALDLTRLISGHLTCIDVSIPQIIAGDVYGGPSDTTLLDIEREREADNKARLQARLAREDIPWDWADTTNTLADGVLEAAALADIIVLNRQLEGKHYPDMAGVAGRVVMHSRKPVLAVPETLTRLQFARAVVAWDGHPSSAAAMRACVPLLTFAEEVEIFMVRDGSEQSDPTQAAEYLSRHGIHADVVSIDNHVARADELILEECARRNADYVVMGAYSRGRLLETFGGVTKRMLANSTLPLIMGH